MNGRVFDAYSSESSATNYHTFFRTQQNPVESALMLTGRQPRPLSFILPS
jgi:hypothetical protein